MEFWRDLERLPPGAGECPRLVHQTISLSLNLRLMPGKEGVESGEDDCARDESLASGQCLILCWAGAVAPPGVGIVSSSGRPPRPLMDCFHPCPQAESAELLVWQWEPQSGLGDGTLSSPAPKISEPQLQHGWVLPELSAGDNGDRSAAKPRPKVFSGCCVLCGWFAWWNYVSQSSTWCVYCVIWNISVSKTICQKDPNPVPLGGLWSHRWEVAFCSWV